MCLLAAIILDSMADCSTPPAVKSWKCHCAMVREIRFVTGCQRITFQSFPPEVRTHNATSARIVKAFMASGDQAMIAYTMQGTRAQVCSVSAEGSEIWFSRARIGKCNRTLTVTPANRHPTGGLNPIEPSDQKVHQCSSDPHKHCCQHHLYGQLTAF
ncbi:hypothetical protein LY76DRAFT_305180 [Colletotrichum caudatum]|nr:hypothetical protein LY76DRAFT_305180 [Colletotrichum caudatum]